LYINEDYLYELVDGLRERMNGCVDTMADVLVRIQVTHLASKFCHNLALSMHARTSERACPSGAAVSGM